jgi:hypothetical protein
MSYGDDETSGATSGMSDTAKIGILAGTLGLTGLVAWMYRDGGWLAKKTAKGRNFNGGSPTFPVGGAAWAAWEAQHTASGYGGSPTAPVGSAQWAQWEAEHTASGGSPTAPIGSAQWAQWEAEHTATGPTTYTAVGGETANVVASKYGMTAGDVVSLNPGVSWPLTAGQSVAVIAPFAPPPGGSGPFGPGNV